MKKHPIFDIYVTTDGRVYSSSGKERKVKPHPNGYVRVSIWKDGAVRNCGVHRLVAQTYLENPDNKPEVNHKDGVKSNNHVTNLEWCTPKENKEHAWENDLYTSVLDKEQVHKICQMLQDGRRSIDIAKEFGLHKDYIASIRAGRNWLRISKDYDLRTKKSQTKSTATVTAICHQIATGKTTKEIAEAFSMKPHEINRIKRKEIFKDITEKFSFPNTKF